MHYPNLYRLAFCMLTFLLPASSMAQLSAHFRTDDLDYNSNAGKCDVCVLCTPTCELYFEIGIFTTGGQSGALALYPGSCSYHEWADGFWNYANQEISRPIPNLSSSATVYFALFDEDTDLIDNDDLLGFYSSTLSGPTPGTIVRANNNSLPTGGYSFESCDGGAVDDDSTAGRFDFSYSAWFTDATPPDVILNVAHTDPDAPAGYDNDISLGFTWSQAVDIHSGVNQLEYELRRNGVVENTGTLSGTATSAGYTAVDGSVYDYRLRAQNGATIDLQNQAYSNWSEWSDPVLVDASPEIITTISAYTEPGGAPILPGVAQPDNSPYLEWGVSASASPLAGFSYSIDGVPSCFSINTIDAFATLSGLGGGTTVFRVRAVDTAGNCGAVSSFDIAVLLPNDIFGDNFEDPNDI